MGEVSGFGGEGELLGGGSTGSDDSPGLGVGTEGVDSYPFAGEGLLVGS